MPREQGAAPSEAGRTAAALPAEEAAVVGGTARPDESRRAFRAPGAAGPVVRWVARAAGVVVGGLVLAWLIRWALEGPPDLTWAESPRPVPQGLATPPAREPARAPAVRPETNEAAPAVGTTRDDRPVALARDTLGKVAADTAEPSSRPPAAPSKRPPSEAAGAQTQDPPAIAADAGRAGATPPVERPRGPDGAAVGGATDAPRPARAPAADTPTGVDGARREATPAARGGSTSGPQPSDGTRVDAPPVARPATAGAPRTAAAGDTADSRRGAASASAAPTAQPTPLSAAPLPPLRLDELPASVRRAIPTLRIDGDVQSPSAASRLLVVNGQVLREKDTFVPGLRLETIGPDSAIFSWRGQRFQIPYPGR